MYVLKYSNRTVSLSWRETPRLTEMWSKSVFYLFPSELIQFITSGPIIAMEILRDDAICEWKRLLGTANSGVARSDAPGSIRALFGTDGIRNAAHGPDSFACAARVRCFTDTGILLWLMKHLMSQCRVSVTAALGRIYTAILCRNHLGPRAYYYSVSMICPPGELLMWSRPRYSIWNTCPASSSKDSLLRLISVWIIEFMYEYQFMDCE